MGVFVPKSVRNISRSAQWSSVNFHMRPWYLGRGDMELDNNCFDLFLHLISQLLIYIIMYFRHQWESPSSDSMFIYKLVKMEIPCQVCSLTWTEFMFITLYIWIITAERKSIRNQKLRNQQSTNKNWDQVRLCLHRLHSFPLQFQSLRIIALVQTSLNHQSPRLTRIGSV